MLVFAYMFIFWICLPHVRENIQPLSFWIFTLPFSQFCSVYRNLCCSCCKVQLGAPDWCGGIALSSVSPSLLSHALTYTCAHAPSQIWRKKIHLEKKRFNKPLKKRIAEGIFSFLMYQNPWLLTVLPHRTGTFHWPCLSFLSFESLQREDNALHLSALKNV
jgi:hypothetical protein